MGVIFRGFSVLAAVIVSAIGTDWIERHFRMRPRELGAAEPLHFKIDLQPGMPDPWMYLTAPIVAVLGVCWAFVVLPFSSGAVGSDLNIGAFYFLVVVDFVVLGIAIGGWGANAPDSVESCYRIVAQMIAYVVPLGMAVIGPLMMARSLSTVNIVNAQSAAGFWYVVVQPLGFALYIATALMQTYRAPFLEPFSGQIDHGILSVYEGWKALLWRVALSGILFVVSAMGAVLFLGGYSGPILPGPLWMLLKTIIVMALMLWTGSRTRLLSTAQMLSLSWKILIPIGLLNVLIVGVLILFGVGQKPFA